jgi:RNA polymerase sigma factor (sigma-70 family)
MIQKTEFKNLEEYLEEIGKFPLLNQEEEKKLQKEADLEENKQKLFNSNLRLVVSVAKKLLGYGAGIEDLIKTGNEELEKAIDNYNSFAINKPDLATSTYYTWRIRFGIIREIVNKKFPTLTTSIKKSLEENDFDSYYTYFFLEHILINLIIDKESGSKDALAILENSLISTFSDPELENRMSDKNFIREIPEFMEILKQTNPNIS